MGFGLIAIDKNKISLVEMGVLQLARKQNHAERLELIYRKMDMLIRMHKPMAVAIEAPFFGKNVQSMLKLGRAQGVAIAAALMREIPIFEYQPRKIKLSVTGNGNSTKEQVAAMLQNLLDFEEMPKHLDATDALGAAMCHIFQHSPRGFGLKTGKKASNGWGKFVAENKGRVK